MSMRKILNRVSMKTLGRICSVAIAVPAVVAAEFWVWQDARKVFDGRSEATYWFAPDGTATYALNVAQKNWSAAPIRTLHLYGGRDAAPEPDSMAWYDEYGNELEWNATKVGEPSFWRYEAELRRPIDRREWVRYTVWDRAMQPDSGKGDHEKGGIYQEENSDWVFRNNPGLGPENTVTMVFPPNTEIVTAEPANRATVVSGGYCPTVRFDDIRETHTVRWRLHNEPPDGGGS